MAEMESLSVSHRGKVWRLSTFDIVVYVSTVICYILLFWQTVGWSWRSHIQKLNIDQKERKASETRRGKGTHVKSPALFLCASREMHTFPAGYFESSLSNVFIGLNDRLASTPSHNTEKRFLFPPVENPSWRREFTLGRHLGEIEQVLFSFSTENEWNLSHSVLFFFCVMAFRLCDWLYIPTQTNSSQKAKGESLSRLVNEITREKRLDCHWISF